MKKIINLLKKIFKLQSEIRIDELDPLTRLVVLSHLQASSRNWNDPRSK